MKNITQQTNQIIQTLAGLQPVVMRTATIVNEAKLEGFYDESTDTWSNREFKNAASKKHNEQM